MKRPPSTVMLPLLALLIALPGVLGATLPQEPLTEGAQPAPSDLGPMRGLQSEEANIAVEVPEEWLFRVIQDGSYLFEGPEGSDSQELAVIIQFLPKQERPQSNTLLQLGEGLGRIIALPESRLTRLDGTQVAGRPAVFFTASYTGQNTKQEDTPFGHVQMVFEHGNFYYWITFFGPKPLFEKYSPVFQHFLASIRFLDQ